MGRGSAAACEEMALVGALVGEGATATLLPCYHIFGHCDTCLLLFWCLWRTDNPTKAPSVLIDPVGDTRVSEQENALSHPTGATAQASTLCHKGILIMSPPWGKDGQRPSLGAIPKNRHLPTFLWLTKPGSLILLYCWTMLLILVLGEGIRGRCSPFKHNALSVLFVGLPDHLLGHPHEIFGEGA